MSFITMSMKHGRTRDEARDRLVTAVGDIRNLLGSMVRSTVWSPDRSQVRLDGAGFWLEMSVDAENVTATGEVPLLGGLFGGPLRSVLNQVVQHSVQKQLK